MVASWLYFVKHYNEYLEGDVRPWRSTHLCRWSRWSLTQTYELWIGNGLHSSLGGLRHLHCITEVSLIGYFDAGEIWWTVEPLTSQVDGKIVLGFQHLQERSKLSLPAPVYLVKPAWPWRWLRYKIENRLRTVYVHPLLRQVIGKIALDCDTCKDGPGERTSLAEVLAPTMITRGRNLWYEKII